MKNRLIVCIFTLIVCSACQHATKNTSATEINAKKLAIISINDVYRIAGIDMGETGGLARVRALREQILAEYPHVLLLHAGDFLHPSFISKQDNGLAMIQTLNRLDGYLNEFDDYMLVTWGNHEFDKGSQRHVPMMNELLAKSEFAWLDSNINWHADGIYSDQVTAYRLIDFHGFTVGIYSVTTDMVHPEYIESFDSYAKTSAHYVPWLRDLGADFVVALTHHWMPDDLAMMALPENHRPDIIFGGHEHHALTEQVDGRWILKADADGASAIVAEINFNDLEQIQVQPQVVALDKDFPQDPDVLEMINHLTAINDQAYCQKLDAESNCLEEVLAVTQTQLWAEETEIRRFETNLGNLLADLVLNTFDSCDANLALLNSGSIRLNQNIPANANITVKHLEEMFPYPSDLRLIEFDRSLLSDILQHSISSWTANGHWLQVAGVRFVHDPEQQTIDDITLTDTAAAAETIRAVVPFYLISDDTDHDGYDMINESMIVDCAANGAQLKQLFKTSLMASKQALNAKRDGRICNVMRDTCQ